MSICRTSGSEEWMDYIACVCVEVVCFNEQCGWDCWRETRRDDIGCLGRLCIWRGRNILGFFFLLWFSLFSNVQSYRFISMVPWNKVNWTNKSIVASQYYGLDLHTIIPLFIFPIIIVNLLCCRSSFLNILGRSMWSCFSIHWISRLYAPLVNFMPIKLIIV